MLLDYLSTFPKIYTTSLSSIWKVIILVFTIRVNFIPFSEFKIDPDDKPSLDVFLSSVFFFDRNELHFTNFVGEHIRFNRIKYSGEKLLNSLFLVLGINTSLNFVDDAHWLSSNKYVSPLGVDEGATQFFHLLSR